MKFYGNIALNQNELQQAVLQLEADWPANPKVGQVLFKNKIVYICVEVTTGVPFWVPLTRELTTYAHMQPAPETTWTIIHNLKTGTPVVQVWDLDSKMVIPNQIEVIDENMITVSFLNAEAGRAVVLTGSIEGGERQSYSYEWTQTTLSSSWTIVHGLGYLPIVRVFIGNQEVQPLTVTHDSNFQTTVTFSSPQTGMVKFI